MLFRFYLHNLYIFYVNYFWFKKAYFSPDWSFFSFHFLYFFPIFCSFLLLLILLNFLISTYTNFVNFFPLSFFHLTFNISALSQFHCLFVYIFCILFFFNLSHIKIIVCIISFFSKLLFLLGHISSLFIFTPFLQFYLLN